MRYVLGTAAIWLVLSMADMVCLVCRNCEVHELSFIWHVGVYVLLVLSCVANLYCF